MNAGQLHWIPIIWSLNFSPQMYPVQYFMATNSIPKDDVSIDPYFLDIQ